MSLALEHDTALTTEAKFMLAAGVMNIKLYQRSNMCTYFKIILVDYPWLCHQSIQFVLMPFVLVGKSQEAESLSFLRWKVRRVQLYWRHWLCYLASFYPVISSSNNRLTFL